MTPSRAKVLTVSDGVAGGTRDDTSGRALVERLAAAGYEVIEHRVTPTASRRWPRPWSTWPRGSRD